MGSVFLCCGRRARLLQIREAASHHPIKSVLLKVEAGAWMHYVLGLRLCHEILVRLLRIKVILWLLRV
tara:strand:- start:174 stop:377 length:204 start_codon:yes stop_codon:yes gene_type:complete